MIYLLILLILVQILKLTKIVKTDYSNTFCGIFAFSAIKGITDEQLRIAVHKIKILGLYNENRGGQGSGIYMNDHILKCGDKHKTFPSLLENNVLDQTTKNHIMIGHCRKMSRGIVSTENTHPFLINEDLVGVHNGTIENIWKLTSDRKIVTTNITNDSKALYQIIEQEGVAVLNEYKGGAALLWSRLSEPNVMFAYHGAAKKYRNDEKLETERPLFFMKTKEGLYFSSMEESLWAIRENEDEIPEELPTNIVYRITNGKFVNVKITIERENANLYVAPVNNYASSGSYPQTSPSTYNNKSISGVIGKPVGTEVAVGVRSLSLEHPDPAIWRETIPIKAKEDKFNIRIYFHQGRYWESPDAILHGERKILKGGLFATESMMQHGTSYWFYKGVLMQSEKCYKEVVDMEQKAVFKYPDAHQNFAAFISKYAEFPVTNLPNESGRIESRYRFQWFYKGVLAKESFTPKFGSRNYLISKTGLLFDIKPTKKSNEIMFHDSYIPVGQQLTLLNSKNKETSTQTTTPNEITVAMEDTTATTPFRTDSKSTNIFETFDDPCLDSVYEDLQLLYRSLTPQYISALMLFTEAILMHALPVDPDPEEIKTEMNQYLMNAVNCGISVRESFGDRDRLLDVYVTKAYEEEDERAKPWLESQNFEWDATDMSYKYVDTSDSAAMEAANQDMQNWEDMYENGSGIFETLAEIDKMEEEAEEKNDLEIIAAIETTEDIIDILAEAHERAAELGTNTSKFGVDVADSLHRAIDNIKHNLTSIAQEHDCKELENKINNKINSY